MKYFVFATFCLAVSVAMPLADFENENRVRYYVIPISREKRRVVLDDDHHRLDGSASITKNFDPNGHGPYRLGGELDYTNKDSGLGAFVTADYTRGYGTDVSGGLKYNILHGKDYGLDVAGQYSRHLGGSGPSSVGASLNGHWSF